MDDRSRPFGRRADLHKITIVHGDRVRAFHVDTRLVTGGAAILGAFVFTWLATTAALFVRDEFFADPLSRQVRAERGYEDRVAALRAEVDRINARQLIDQDAFEAKLDGLVARQAKLGEVQAKFTGLAAKIGDLGLATGSIKPPAIAPVGAALAPPPAAATATPAPIAPPPAAGPAVQPFDTEKFATPLRSSWLGGGSRPGATRDAGARIAAAEHQIDAFEKQQSAALAGLVDIAESRDRAWTRALARVGFKVADALPAPRTPAARPGDAVGGPFVPVPPDALGRAENALGRLAAIRAVAAKLPLARPLVGERTVTSDFGVRMDPFLGTAAMHTGLDFRAETGEPVRVTGPGVVTGAGRQGGYGLCVDVDHGNGVVTRYGHMSSISVTPGDRLKVGDVVGLAGSTGRSTSPHLHYETRVSGEAVDPRDWLEAGRTLGF